jgi:hypothetical protein
MQPTKIQRNVNKKQLEDCKQQQSLYGAFCSLSCWEFNMVETHARYVGYGPAVSRLNS